MNHVHHNSVWFSKKVRFAAILLPACAICLPLSVARADREDRWEEYQERLEDQREEAEERWEDEQEAYEDWQEDRREAWEDRRERQIVVPRYGRRDYYRDRGYWEEPLPPPQYYGNRGPVYQDYYVEQPRPYREQRYYRGYGPEYRYYGTGDVGYTEYGRERSVQVGPFKVYWRR